MSKWAQGKFKLSNPAKYVGNKTPTYRSSWEFQFMQFCDNNPSIVEWASEAIKIPYRNPITGKNTIYVPDFLIVYVDKTGQKRAELVEVKPFGQSTLEEAKTTQQKATVIVNMAKWEAARAFCKQQNITFRVITERDIFRSTGKK